MCSTLHHAAESSTRVMGPGTLRVPNRNAEAVIEDAEAAVEAVVEE